MIKTFKHKPLAELWTTGKSAKIDAKMQDRILRRLDHLNVAATATEMKIAGYNFHPLRGKPQRYSVHVNGPWYITFEFEGGNATNVDFEQYH
jgi:proteic killer suppression protein